MALQEQVPQNWLKRFLIIWIGQAFSILGSKLVSFALIWWMTKETGSAMVLATASTIHYIPQIFIGPFIGALVDRWNRRRVLIIADSAIAVATLVLVFLFWTGLIQIWHVYVLLFLRALGGTFHFPAMQASMTLLVPDKHLARVAGINQVVDGGINILGPALGAVLLAVLPVQGVLSIDVLTAAIAVGALLFIAIPQPVNTNAVERITPKVVLNDVVEGFKYVSAWRGLMIILGVAMLMNFISAPTGTYIPLLVTDFFKGGVWHLGLIESLSGAGMILGGLILGIWGGFKRKIFNLLAGLFVTGLSFFVIGLTPATLFLMAAGAFMVQGIANTISNGGAISIFQSLIKADMQGRVFGLVGSLTSIISPIALLVSAPMVEQWGIKPIFTVSGVVFMVTMFLLLLVPDVMHIETSNLAKTKLDVENPQPSTLPAGGNGSR